MSKYDWSNVPKEVKWIATDSDMNVFGFTHFPKEVYANCFSCGEHRSSFLLIILDKYKTIIDIDANEISVAKLAPIIS